MTICKCSCMCETDLAWTDFMFCKSCRGANWGTPTDLAAHRAQPDARDAWGRAVVGRCYQIWVPRCPWCGDGPRAYRQDTERGKQGEEGVLTLCRESSCCGAPINVKAELDRARGARHS